MRAEVGSCRSVATQRCSDQEELGILRDGSVGVTFYPYPQRLPQVRRRVGKAGMRIDVMFGLENVDCRSVSFEHNVVERLDANANSVSFGQATQRLKQGVSALVEIAQNR